MEAVGDSEVDGRPAEDVAASDDPNGRPAAQMTVTIVVTPSAMPVA